MSNLVNHVLMNKLDDELNKAINEVGGDTSGAKGPWDYPAIIKEQLGAKGMSADLKAGPGIVIRDFHGQKFICSTSGALTTGALNPPAGSYKQPVSEVIEAGTPVQEVFEALFYKILPKMSSVYKGDIIIADKSGSDRYNEEDERTGLIPSAHYLRLYVANRQEPVYICLSGHGLINNESGNADGSIVPTPSVEYTGGESEYISVSVNDSIITASLNQKGIDLFNKIVVIENNVSTLNEIVNTQVSELSSIKSSVTEIDQKVSTVENKVSSLDIDKIQEAISKVSEIDKEISNVESQIADLTVIVNENNNIVEAITSTVNNLSGKVATIENQVSEIHGVLEDLGGLDLSEVQSSIDTLKSDVSGLKSDVSGLESTIETKAEKSEVESAFNIISELESTIETKAEKSEVESIHTKIDDAESKLVEVESTIVEIQQTSVTQEQVNTIVEAEVTNVINKTEVVDGKVKELILDALEDENDNEIKVAFENVVEEIVQESVSGDTTSAVNDIFANL